MAENRFSIELLARTALSSRVHLLRFAAHGAFRWAAGQHLIVVGKKGQELFLPYSFASAHDPAHPGRFELAVAFRAGADAMDELELGDKLEAEGPFGQLAWQAEPRPAALLVGVGTGIAPLRALVQAELARPASRTRVLLLAGHRALDDVIFRDDFERLAREHSRFHFIPTLTLGGPEWSGKRGRVQAQLIEAVSALGSCDAYVCGRLDMVTDVCETLVAHGVPAERVRSEGY